MIGVAPFKLHCHVLESKSILNIFYFQRTLGVGVGRVRFFNHRATSERWSLCDASTSEISSRVLGAFGTLRKTRERRPSVHRGQRPNNSNCEERGRERIAAKDAA